MVKSDGTPPATAIEVLANVSREERAAVLAVLAEAYPFMKIVDIDDSSGIQKVNALLANDDLGTVFVAFQYPKTKRDGPP